MSIDDRLDDPAYCKKVEDYANEIAEQFHATRVSDLIPDEFIRDVFTVFIGTMFNRDPPGALLAAFLYGLILHQRGEARLPSEVQ